MDSNIKLKRLTFVVPEELHKRIKFEAIFVNVTLRQYVIRAILEKMQRENKFRE